MSKDKTATGTRPSLANLSPEQRQALADKVPPGVPEIPPEVRAAMERASQ